jgi:hypothetical protein
MTYALQLLKELLIPIGSENIDWIIPISLARATRPLSNGISEVDLPRIGGVREKATRHAGRNGTGSEEDVELTTGLRAIHHTR